MRVHRVAAAATARARPSSVGGAARLAGAGLGVVAGGAAAAAAGLAVRVLLSERSAVRTIPGGAAVILVFGGRAIAGRPTREVRARLDHAVVLWRAGVAPVVAVSGGGTGELDEPAAMTNYLAEQGLPPDAIQQCVPGENTRRTLSSARADYGEVPMVAVSSAYHAARIAAEARRQGLSVVVSAPESPELHRPRAHRVRVGTEILALVWYALPPRLAQATHPGIARHRVASALIG